MAVMLIGDTMAIYHRIIKIPRKRAIEKHVSIGIVP